MKIGILGGTFDPPHMGHLTMARLAKEALELDEVMLIPAHRNPLKDRRVTDGRLRLQMTAALAMQEDWLSISDLEIERGGKSYTIETVRELQLIRPARYWVLMGSDSYRHIASWREADKLAEMCRFGVFDRGRETGDWARQFQSRAVLAATDLIPGRIPAISSTQIRRQVADEMIDDRLTLPEVWQTIQKEKLYRD